MRKKNSSPITYLQVTHPDRTFGLLVLVFLGAGVFSLLEWSVGCSGLLSPLLLDGDDFRSGSIRTFAATIENNVHTD